MKGVNHLAQYRDVGIGGLAHADPLAHLALVEHRLGVG